MPQHAEHVFPAELSHLAAIRAVVRDAARRRGFEDRQIDAIVLAVDEACTNIIQHGYRGSKGEIEMRLSSLGQGMEVRLSDRAPVFDPTRAPVAVDRQAPLEERPIGGLGVIMMRENATQLTHAARPGGGNELVLRFDARSEKGSLSDG